MNKKEEKGSAKNSKELSRINKIAGQIAGIQNMVNDGRYCPDIINQIEAARSALLSLKLSLLENHLQHCVAQTFSSSTEKEKLKMISEIMELLKRTK